MNKDKGVLVYINERPFKACENLQQANALTRVPIDTIISLIERKPTTEREKANGGCTAPGGWGFDWLA